ncbi:hypothetical protein BDV23DRAFT_152324 [Aspergillus alliaceus]|uniref:Uncharacterized protein n=1 Tax=Petromyces alliaceus TaxID=209559 RepID=A0A5N7CCP7_PETAA|nr:hypothetical protein BDV23DRAFT_152324 [Aspergillus alliaceus]
MEVHISPNENLVGQPLDLRALSGHNWAERRRIRPHGDRGQKLSMKTFGSPQAKSTRHGNQKMSVFGRDQGDGCPCIYM